MQQIGAIVSTTETPINAANKKGEVKTPPFIIILNSKN